MKVGILGELTRFEELKQALPANADITHNEKLLPEPWSNYDFIFDLNFDTQPYHIELSGKELPKTALILSSAFIELLAIQHQLSPKIFGMNCLPTFINRSVKEMSYHSEEQLPLLISLGQQLTWEIVPVKDRVGMVTPRILFMIINEAFYTLQEGTANKEAIDTGMKLGTNYPFGPFEWSEKIGLKNVVMMLDKLYLDTKDERYKICPLLKTTSYR